MPLLLLTQTTVVANVICYVSSIVLVLYHIYVQSSNKLGSLKKASSTQGNIYTVLGTTMDVMFLRATG